jgi:hypothetical protein
MLGDREAFDQLVNKMTAGALREDGTEDLSRDLFYNAPT